MKIFYNFVTRNFMFLQFYQFLGDFVLTVGAAIIWSLAFESPVIALEKLIFKIKDNTALQKTEKLAVNETA